MFIKAAALAAIFGTVSVAALSEVHQIVSRQFTSSQIPSACQSQCTTALTIYNACTSGDTSTCLSVCQPSTYSGFVGCFQCILTNTPGVTGAEVQALQSAVNQLASACQAAGSSVSAVSFSGATASASGSASRSGASSISGISSISSAAASISSAASASVSSSAGGLASSAGSLASSASSVAASATSKAAGTPAAVMPKNVMGGLVALVGVVGGAALVL